jgi:hypothetical protein
LPTGALPAWARGRLGEFAVVAGLALVAVAIQALRTTLLTTDSAAFPDPGWDHHAYIGMARDNPLDFHLVPFGWRFLVPLAAKALPFGLQTSFFSSLRLHLATAVVVNIWGGLSRPPPVCSAPLGQIRKTPLPDAAILLAMRRCLRRPAQAAAAAMLVVGGGRKRDRGPPPIP